MSLNVLFCMYFKRIYKKRKNSSWWLMWLINFACDFTKEKKTEKNIQPSVCIVNPGMDIDQTLNHLLGRSFWVYSFGWL